MSDSGIFGSQNTASLALAGLSSDATGSFARRFSPVPRIVAVLLAAAAFALCFAVFDDVRELLFRNSDLLQPVDYAHTLLHHLDIAGSFQVNRSPSFVPDIAAIVGLSAILPSWEAVMLVYAALSYASLVLLGGVIAGKISGRRAEQAVPAFFCVSSLALLTDLAVFKQSGVFHHIFLPLIHTGAFLVSLAGLLLGRLVLRRPTALGYAALVLLSLLGVFSDKLFVGAFAVPFAVAAFGIARAARTRRAWTSAAGAVAAVGAGCVLGVLTDRVVFATVLTRFGDLPIGLELLPGRLAAVLQDIRFYLVAVAALLAVAAPLAWRWRTEEEHYWRLAGGTAAVVFVLFLPMIYADIYSGRYVEPASWWGTIVLTAAALRFRPRLPLAAGLGTCALFLLMVATGRSAPRFDSPLQHESALARCLSPLVEQGRLHAGIAGFWVARPTELASGWTLQIAQVTTDGSAFVWGNNRKTFFVREDSPHEPALFDYAIIDNRGGLDRLSPQVAMRRYGKPDETFMCGRNDVWVYRRPGGIGAALTATLPRP